MELSGEGGGREKTRQKRNPKRKSEMQIQILEDPYVRRLRVYVSIKFAVSGSVEAVPHTPLDLDAD